ncbi:MAG: DUF6017 domain-containing protein [Clostridia bacterium]|nr:DUF6017 domain-containing protein [Clostridia bacterium]
MSKIQDGFFRNKVPFVPISQVVAKDKEISLKAKGLYLLIQSYITIPNFKLYKSYLMSVCVEGQCSFDSAWNELKEKGYLKIYKIAKSDSKGFYYEYELLDAAEPDTPALIVIRKDGTIVEKEQENNDNPTETVEQPEETTDESVSSVFEHTEKKENQEENSENSNKESYDYQTTVEKVNNQIGYDDAVELYKMLNSQYSDNAIKMISVLRDIIVEILLCKKDTIYIAGENRNIDMVKAIFKKITSSHIDNVITTCAEVFKDGTNTVTNPKNYLTTSLYNSVANGTFANIYP